MLWLAGLLFLILRMVARKFDSKKYMWSLPFVFLALAVFAFAFAPLPFGGKSVVALAVVVLNFAFGWLASWIGVSLALIATVLLVGVLALGLVDLLHDHRPDGFAKTMIFTAPVLALMASGTFADQVLNVIQRINTFGPAMINNLAG